MAKNDEEKAAVAAAARRVSAQTGVSAAVLLAVAIAETAGVPWAVFGGRREPLIRFEGHVFDRLLSPQARGAARAAGLSAEKAGAIGNPASQDGRWRLLDRAASIDRDAAYAAVSWGLGQVMGTHARRLGYDGPQALASEARGSIEGQFRLMAAFLAAGDLHRRLERGDAAGFARLYNGPAYRRNGYDTKIQAALAEARRRLGPSASPDGETPAPAPRETAKGWSKRGGGLSVIASWLIHRFSTPAPTRSSSTLTARSSALRTIRPPFA